MVLFVVGINAGAQARVRVTRELYPGAVENPRKSWILSRVVDDLMLPLGFL